MLLQKIRQFFRDQHAAATGLAGNGDGTAQPNGHRRVGGRGALAVDEGKTTIQVCIYHKSPRGF
jgi:hypothetical protein